MSNYNSAQLSVRQRLSDDVVFDFNYTFAHSLDNASGLQNTGNFGTASLIFNPLNPDLNYANSDFDIRHNITANWIVGLPFGRGKKFLSGAGKVTNGFLGGWDLTGILRWNSGLPTQTALGAPLRPFAFQRWATNWQISSGMVSVRPVETSPGDFNGEPNLFADPTAVYQSYRDPRPGEAGDRNTLRQPGYFTLDAGLTQDVQNALGRPCVNLPLGSLQRYQHAAIHWFQWNRTEHGSIYFRRCAACGIR